MDINQNTEKAMDEKVKEFDTTKDLTLFFENFIKTSKIIKDEEVVKGLRIKLKVLDTGELLTAESVLSLTNPGIPTDIVMKVRAAAILSQAILVINGMDIEKDDLTKQENRQRRTNLYEQLLKMPALVVQKIYELYIAAVKEQNEIYSDGSMVGKIENF